jgi:tetratricopeptide (TPR) repeat protein
MRDHTVIARSEATKQSLKTRLLRVLCTLAMTVIFVASASAAENAADTKKFYEKVVAMQPANGNAHFDLGNAYLLEKRYDDAFSQYEKAGKLGLAASRMDSYYFNLSVCYAGLGKMNEAVRSLEECIKVNPKNQEARDLLILYRGSP